MRHEVDPDKNADEPAHTSTKVIESDDTVFEITRESADESSGAASETDKSTKIGYETTATGNTTCGITVRF
jgi:hypothetical protein